MNIIITASDGKEFKGITDRYKELLEEVNTYEAALKLKKMQLEEARKKAAEEKKQREANEKIDLESISSALNQLNYLVKEYEKKYDRTMLFYRENTNLTVKDAKEVFRLFDF